MAFPAEFRHDVYLVVEQLQEMLGEINDHAVACVRFRRWIKDERHRGDRLRLRKLLIQERKTLNKSLQNFEDWWTPAQAACLRESFERTLN